jgi:4-amino-4-deoxy-L-arabinose transferase-like glycosyltransferase
MNSEKEGFLGGFLVLGFAIFIVGFLAGVVTAFISASTESATLEIIVFAFGFVAGAVTASILLIIVKSRKLTKHSS